MITQCNHAIAFIGIFNFLCFNLIFRKKEEEVFSSSLMLPAFPKCLGELLKPSVFFYTSSIEHFLR